MRDWKCRPPEDRDQGLSALVKEASLERGLPLAGASAVKRIAAAQQLTLIGGTIALPLAVLWTASDTYALPKLLLARLLALALATLWFVRCAIERRITIKRTPIDVPLIAFVLSAGVSTVFAVNRNLAMFGAYNRYEGFLTIALYAALFWLTVQSLQEPEAARRLLTALLLSGYIAAVFAIGQAVLTSAQGVVSRETAFTFGGVERAAGTMGNPNLLASFLAMLLPLAVHRLLGTSSMWARIAWLNVTAVMSLALLMTFSRSGLIAAVIGVAIVLSVRLRLLQTPKRVIWPVLALVMAAGLLAVPAHGGMNVGHSVLTRIASIADATGGSNATRLHVWADSLRLIASRPIVGFGPDTFGLVFPHFQTGIWTPGYQIDKAHADALQVAATQGLLGLASYIGVLLGAILIFWGARRLPEGTAVFGGWLAYEIITQVNFSWLPAAAPFWIFLGAAAVVCAPDMGRRAFRLRIRGRLATTALTMAAATALMLVLPAVVRPYQAEMRFSGGLEAELRGDEATALTQMQEARRLSASNPVYAGASGNLLLMGGQFEQARMALKNAIDLGSEDPAVARSLMIVQQLTGHP